MTASHRIAATSVSPNGRTAAISASELLHGVERARDPAVRQRRGAFVEGVLANVPVIPFGLAEARVIHGRSGGRLKAAVHGRLKTMPSVRAFRLDPRNPGVTIVQL